MRSVSFIVLLAGGLRAILPAMAKEDSLFTSSLTYCAVPDVLMVQEFEFEFFKNNASLFFALSATNLASNLNASANIIVNTYGMTPLNYTFNLCDVLQGQLCPLPQYNVTGSLSLPLPSGIELPIPEIAFQIPDLEAVAQVTLRRVETGEAAVCLQATLSNGWSLHIQAVAIATGTIALISLLSSIFQSFYYPQSSTAVFRTITTFSFFQQIALSGMLHLNFPSAYTAFVTNFAWSFGLFSRSDIIQSAIERMRAGTGSNLSEEPQAPTAYSDRTLSPYNLAAGSHDKSFDIGTFIGGTDTQPYTPDHSFITPAVITTSSQTLDPGIPVYINYVNVATGNAFMSMFFTLLFLFIAFGFLHLAVFGGLKWASNHKKGGADKKLEKFRSVLASNSIRLVQICLLPGILLSLFQWTLHDSWLSTFISVIIFLGIMSALGYPTFLIIREALANGHQNFNEDTMQKSPQGALIAPYKYTKYYFFLVALFAPVIRAAFVSLARSNGFVQVVGLVTLEVLYMIILLCIRPFHNRRGDVFEVTIAFIRLISTGALLPFVKEKLDVDAIPRVAIGIGVAIVLSVGVVLISLNVIAHALPWRWAWRTIRGIKKDKKGAEESLDTDSELEKGPTCVPSSAKEEDSAPTPVAKD